jgi:hypothetical protein
MAKSYLSRVALEFTWQGPLPFVGECAKLWVKISTRVEALFPRALINPVLRGWVNYFAIGASKRRSTDRQRLSLSAWRATISS